MGEGDLVLKMGKSVIEFFRGRMKRGESRQYLKKMIYTYSLVIYTIVIVTVLIFFIYIQYSRIVKEEERNDAFFKEYVEKYEHVYEDLFSAVGNLKEMSRLDLFALSGKDSYYEKMTLLQQKLNEFSKPYRKKGFEFAVYREGEELVVTDTSSQNLKYLLKKWGLTAYDYAKAVKLLRDTSAKDSILLTDQNIFYLTCKSYLNERVYLICHIPFDRVDIPGYDEALSVYFWSQDSKVIDFRQQELPEEIRTVGELFTGHELERKVSGNLEYRFQLSNYFDIVYCGVVARSYTEMAVGIIILILCALPLIYGFVYLVTRMVSKKVYQPIEALTNEVFESSESADVNENEFVRIANKMRSIKTQNEELQKRLDILSEDFQKTVSEREAERGKTIQSDDLRDRLEEYILHHLSEDISLYDVAEHFGLSFNYMSVVFKNKMDHNFKEYLSYQRYVRALKLMQENPGIKIGEVASQIGLYNVNTFIRIFKKYSGTTPKQYMTMLKDETSSI